MNTFNRILLIVIGIVVLAGALLVLLAVTGVIPHYLPFLKNIATTGTGRIVNIAVSAVVALAMVILIVIETTSTLKKTAPLVIGMSDDISLPANKTLNRQDILVISEMEKGMTTIDIQSICDLVENVGVTVRSVHRFDCKVGRCPAGLMLYCRALVALGSDVVEIADRSRKRVIESVEQLTGLAVDTVDIKVIYDKAKKQAESLTVH
jgi:hypothetical protein